MPAVEASDARKTDGDAEHLVLRTEGLVKRYGKRTVVNDDIVLKFIKVKLSD